MIMSMCVGVSALSMGGKKKQQQPRMQYFDSD